MWYIGVITCLLTISYLPETSKLYTLENEQLEPKKSPHLQGKIIFTNLHYIVVFHVHFPGCNLFVGGDVFFWVAVYF